MHWEEQKEHEANSEEAVEDVENTQRHSTQLPFPRA